MTPEEYEWEIDVVKASYQFLNLTFSQAEEVYRYESEKRSFSEKESLSIWEQWDYESFCFNKILGEDQYVFFKENQDLEREAYCRELVKQDKQDATQIDLYKQYIQFFDEQFLPEMFKDPSFYTFSWLSAESVKIQFVKAEYRKSLVQRKKQILIDHFRHYRDYKPHHLEVSLLRQQLSYLWPDYRWFSHQMDEPTAAACKYLESKLVSFAAKYDHFIDEQLQSLRRFEAELFGSHRQNSPGWHTVVESQTSSDEERKERIMNVLLLDQKRYGA